MIWSRGRQTNLLRSTLREFYPAALVAFDDLASPDALEVLRVAPTPSSGRACRAPRSPPLYAAAAASAASMNAPGDPSGVAHRPARRSRRRLGTAMGASVAASVAVIATMNAQIAAAGQRAGSGF